ncbi:MAG: hypothetical protein NC388_02230 [Clostridium sp.]|nr:hypothetical protein [Clostridium sp.]
MSINNRFKILRFGILVAVLLSFVEGVWAQVTVDVEIDTLEFFIGKQSHIRLDVSCDAGSVVQFPLLSKRSQLVPGVEIVDIAVPDTQYLNDGKRMQVSNRYTVTSFDSAFYYLPPFVVTVDDKNYESKSLALRVLSPEVDTLHIDHYAPPYETMDLSYDWEDWQDVFVHSVFMLVCMILLIYLYIRYRDNKPIIKIIKVDPVEPPHQKALKEIDRIKAEKKWAQEDSKAYYTELTDTLRVYIESRYGFSAMEMTTDEIIERLLSSLDSQALYELQDLLRTADLVKFAKYNTLINENDRNLVNAIQFIDKTKVEEIDAKPKAQKVTIEQKRSRTALIIMVVLMSICGIAVSVFLVKIIWQLIQLY